MIGDDFDIDNTHPHIRNEAYVETSTKNMAIGTTFFVIAVAAFVLNLVSVAAVYKIERKKIKRTQMILLNFVCLLLVPAMLGTAADRIYGGWKFGLLGCKVSNVRLVLYESCSLVSFCFMFNYRKFYSFN